MSSVTLASTPAHVQQHRRRMTATTPQVAADGIWSQFLQLPLLAATEAFREACVRGWLATMPDGGERNTYQ